MLTKGTILALLVSILLLGSWIQGQQTTGLAGDKKDEIAVLRYQVTLLERRVSCLERRLHDMTQPRMMPLQR
jgi:hypothetical protein